MKVLSTILFLLLLNLTVMAKQLTTEILIHASPAKVWSVLTDFEAYPEWNPFIHSIQGKVAVGNKIEARISAPSSKVMTFKPKVLTFKKHQEFSWLGHLGVGGLFDGEHKFELIDQGNGTTQFRHSEKFKGILVPLFWKKLDTNTRQGFIEMNEKLKERAEQQ